MDRSIYPRGLEGPGGSIHVDWRAPGDPEIYPRGLEGPGGSGDPPKSRAFFHFLLKTLCFTRVLDDVLRGGPGGGGKGEVNLPQLQRV